MDPVTEYTNKAAKRAQELKDLDVDRVDLVDKPATGRAFLLFKNRDIRQYPIETQPTRTGPHTARLSAAPIFDMISDEGADALGREYSDEAYATLGGLNSRPTAMSPIPDAGAGATLETDTRGIAYRPTAFPTTVGGKLQKPVEPYLYNEVGPVKMPGGMRLLSPANSGIADAAPFIAPEPATVVKREAGIFKNMIEPRAGDVSNFFDEPQSDSDIKKAARGLWGSIFSNPRDKDK